MVHSPRQTLLLNIENYQGFHQCLLNLQFIFILNILYDLGSHQFFFFSFHYYISTPEICVSEKFYVKRVSCHIQVEAPIINFFFRISIRKRGRAKKNVNFQEFSPMKTR